MSEKLLRELTVEILKKRFSKEYKDVKTNPDGNPDFLLSNHGLVVAAVQVESANTISDQKADKWKELTQDGSKLIIMVPKDEKMRTMEILWNKGLADKVSVGTYEIVIKLP